MSNDSGVTSPLEVNSGSDADGLRRLRETIAESVMGQMKHEIPGLSPHLGEDYENAADPEALVYRATGGSFRWLAFAFSPWRMWDLHVGVVLVERHWLSVGFHISERARTSLLVDLERLAAGINASVKHQKAAVEYQANLPPIDADTVPMATIVDTIAGLCRKYAGVAAAVSCPVEMRDGHP